MKKLFTLSLIAIGFAACDKKEEDKPTAKTREDILGSYNFSNSYEMVETADGVTHDTTRSAKNYIIVVEKPAPDTFGTNAVVIKNMIVKHPSMEVIATFSDGVLSPHSSMWPSISMTQFQGVLQDNKSIDVTYKRNNVHVDNMGYEKGAGNAVKR